jgi:hypothetical protein
MEVDSAWLSPIQEGGKEVAGQKVLRPIRMTVE